MVAIIATKFASAVSAIVIASSIVIFPGARYLFAVVHIVLHEEDALAAGSVFTAVFSPVLGVPRRYAHLDRRTVHDHRLNHHRLTIENPWLRIVTNIDSAV